MNNRAVVVVSQGFGGHRLAYVRTLLESQAIENFKGVYLVSSQGCSFSPEYRIQLTELEGRFTLVQMSDVSLESLDQFLKSLSRPLIIFLDGDPWLGKLIRRMRPLPFEAKLLVMRRRGQAQRMPIKALQTLAKGLRVSVVRYLSRVEVFELVQSHSANIARWQVPDPVQFAADLHLVAELRSGWAAIGASEKISWLGVLGVIGKRKNLDMIAEAIAECQSDTRRLGLVVGGVAETDEDEVETWLTPLVKSGIPVIRMARELSNIEFDSVLFALDGVIAAHSNDAPSGIVAKALEAGTPVICAGSIELREAISEFAGAGVWVPLSVKDLTYAISQALQLSPKPSNSDSSRVFAQRLLEG